MSESTFFDLQLTCIDFGLFPDSDVISLADLIPFFFFFFFFLFYKIGHPDKKTTFLTIMFVDWIKIMPS